MAASDRPRPPGVGQRTLFDPPPGAAVDQDDGSPRSDAPLADRMRPRHLGEVVGQSRVVGPETALVRAIGHGELPSLVLWGPPGCGKTTLARLLVQAWGGRLVSLSAVTAGVADVRRVVAEAENARGRGERTALFLDEIHRFSRSQQDALLPHVERGTLRLIGATTENPSFEVNGALLSRCRVVRLEALGDDAVRTIVRRAVEDAERGLGGQGVRLSVDGEQALVSAAAGDARVALGALEMACAAAVPAPDGSRNLEREDLEAALLRRLPRHDRAGDGHYDTVSALIKSVRGSDADAAVYWLARLLEAGEDPLFVARRLVLLAAEDIGLADPGALSLAVAAFQATHAIGMPEAYLPLAEAALYLALAPKSNSAYVAYGQAREDVLAHPDEPVPLHLRNAPTALMRDMGYARGYRYAHDAPGGVAAQSHLPDALATRAYYAATNNGAEIELGARARRLRLVLAGEATMPETAPKGQEGRPTGDAERHGTVGEDDRA